MHRFSFLFLNYIDFVKCLHCTVGIGMLMQPGVAHNDPLKYLILILLLSGDVAENPGPVAESTTVKNLSVCHINAQSIYNKLDLIAVELSKYDIITVSETWLDQTISVTDLQRTSVVFMYSSALLSSEKMESEHYN